MAPGNVAPNPKVGAVVVRHGVVLGEGWHQRFGEAHAEVNALLDARERNADIVGSTVYVTLEPCNHQGKTPPCTQALIEAGVQRVVYALPDPNPMAAGGRERLEEAGVDVTAGIMREEAAELNAPFLYCLANATRPFITLKLALSVDGAIADVSRRRSELTGPQTRRVVHEMRADADAVAVGIGTALADDPELTVRFAAAPRVPPARVVFDRKARLPRDGKLAASARQVPLVVVTDGSRGDSESELQSLGVQVVSAPDLGLALQKLRRLNICHLFVEGGAGIASALIEGGLVDRLIIFQASVILGEGALHAFGSVPSQIAKDIRFHAINHRAVGNDVMTVFRVTNVATVINDLDDPGR